MRSEVGRGAGARRRRPIEGFTGRRCELRLFHSDAEGFYVPVDFKNVLFDEEQQLAGGMLGSSQRLFSELVEVAPALGIKLDRQGALPDEEASRISEIAEAQQTPLFRELLSWMSLYEAARLSIQHRTAIVFQ